MKKILLLIFMGIHCSCEAQIYQNLEGSWLPEKYIEATIAKDTIKAAEYLFPIEVLQIVKQDAQKFARDYVSDLSNRDTINVDDFILVTTYKSELNGFSIEEVTSKGKVKYRILNLSNGMNLKYIPLETVERYKKSDIYISRSKNRLLLEIIEKEKSEKIYYVNGVNDCRFKDFDDAERYLKAVAKRPVNTPR